MCVCVCVSVCACYHLGSFVKVVTGEDLQRTGGNQSFSVVHPGPYKHITYTVISTRTHTVINTMHTHIQRPKLRSDQLSSHSGFLTLKSTSGNTRQTEADSQVTV